MGTYLNSGGPVDRKPSPARSFFSRFSLPGRTRPRHIADFHISPSDPHRQYAAGDKVYGSVVVTVVKPIRITHLTVSLHGYVRAYRGPAIADRETTNPVLTGVSSAQYHGNGHASLFQDEQVLAGEGRLEVSKYEFRFELQFPEKGLPSSIDFERGTISYMITATLTRPTAINPTMSCDRKITLVEKIDVGLLTQPRPKMIYVEPISKKSTRRRKQQPGFERPPITPEVTDHGSDRDSTIDPVTPAPDETHDSNEIQRSPVQQDVRSEMSGDSGRTSNSNISDRGLEWQAATAHAASTKLQAVDEKTIIATMQLLRGGALAGDNATVKVTVQHTKPLKSMHGLIVTLYRRGEIDTAPPSSMFLDGANSEDELRKAKKEDYYPRSRTGLSGLSLSSSSRSRPHFRKDLSQVVTPLIIDPATLETTVTASVKVPEDAFPTIKGVPGGMISFRYYIEVVMDLGGRMASYLQGGNQSRGGNYGSGQPSADNGNYMSRGGNIIDTEPLRQGNLKGVVWGALEMVMGTVDSSRDRGRSNTLRTQQLHDDSVSQDEIISPWSEDFPAEDQSGQWAQPTPNSTHTAPPPLPPLNRQSTTATQHRQPTNLANGEVEEAPAYVPPPEVPNENNMTEKERVRQQEQRLLPSQPPESADAGPSSASALALDADSDIYEADDEPPTAPNQESVATPTAPTEMECDVGPSNVAEGPSAPTLEDLEPRQADDKQEIERQRLLIEASAPPEFPDDYEAGPSRATAPRAQDVDDEQPSAPTLTEEDEYGGNYSYRAEAGPSSPRYHAGGSEPLPRYER